MCIFARSNSERRDQGFRSRGVKMGVEWALLPVTRMGSGTFSLDVFQNILLKSVHFSATDNTIIVPVLS